MKPPTEPAAPRIGALSVASPTDLVADLEWYDLEIAHDLGGAELDEVEMRGVRCTASAFTGSRLRRARLIDVTFERCELSGAHLDECSATRVLFRDCRMSGVQMNAARWKDIRFVGCRLDGAGLRMITGERVWFEDCVLRGAELRESKLDGAVFRNCDLTDADFAQARIPDAPLHGSQLDGLRGVDGLQRPVIEPAQVVALSWSLIAAHGVVVDSEEGDM